VSKTEQNKVTATGVLLAVLQGPVNRESARWWIVVQIRQALWIGSHFALHSNNKRRDQPWLEDQHLMRALYMSVIDSRFQEV